MSDDKPESLSVTVSTAAVRSLDEAASRLGASRSVVVERLLREHASQLRPSTTLGHGNDAVIEVPEITFLRRRSKDAVRHRLRSFPERYNVDWRRWTGRKTAESFDVDELRRILGRWQAVRPLRLARADALERMLGRAEPALKALSTLTLRSIREASRSERDALLGLWSLIASSLAENGPAGCVGITKVIMLLTNGRIGPALDSRVRNELGLRKRPRDDTIWLAHLDAIAVDLASFENRAGVVLESLVEVAWRPVQIGRAYDMAAGPRPKR